MSTLKERKEQFVSGLSGGSIAEINIVTSIALVGYLAWCIVSSRLSLNKWSFTGLFIDFCYNWLGLLLSITLYASEPNTLIMLAILPAIGLFFVPLAKASKKPQKPTKPQKKKAFITAYRGGMLIVTCLAILAVDFRVFPRRFAKVETWGTSLMDLGVGSFVFSMGLVSARGLFTKKSFMTRLWQSIRGSLPVLFLGGLRLYFVKNLEYQEHVTEYGVHWNFFITLGLLGPAIIVLEPIFWILPRAGVGLLVTFVYEYFLVTKEEFIPYLLLAKRDNLISANREGLVSLLGYLAIFLIGQSTGVYTITDKPTTNNLYTASNKPSISKWDKMTTVTPVRGLIICFICYSGLFWFVDVNHDYQVSRRFANLLYVLWVVTYNLGALVGYALISSFFDISPVSLDSINNNGLIMFLLANVSTGLVNMSMSTIDASLPVSMVVLMGYASLLAAVSITLNYFGIYIKL